MALKGHSVVFLDRPEIIDSLEKTGLTLEINHNSYKINNPVFAASIEKALDLFSFDIGIFALKSYDTQAGLSSLLPFRNSIPPILCLQNGVENEVVLKEGLGSERIISGTVTSAVGRLGTGKIILEKLRGVGIASGHPISPLLTEAMVSSGLQARIYPNAESLKWSKMLTNLLTNASSAILDMTPSQILSDSTLFKIEIMQLREALSVMKALKIKVTDLPGTPTRLLAFAVESLPFSLSKLALSRAVGSGRGAKMPSFHIDLYSKRGKSEVDYLNGAINRQGRKLGIPTPINQSLTDILLDLTNETIPIDSYSHKPELFAHKMFNLPKTG